MFRSCDMYYKNLLRLVTNVRKSLKYLHLWSRKREPDVIYVSGVVWSRCLKSNSVNTNKRQINIWDGEGSFLNSDKNVNQSVWSGRLWLTTIFGHKDQGMTDTLDAHD